MGLEEHRAKASKSVGFALVTVSDTRQRESDEGGDRIASLLEEAGHRVVERSLVRDNHLDIESAIIRGMQHAEVQAILLTGGTGVAERDITPEVVEEHFDKVLDGFGELFRWLSYQEIGPAAILSRAVGGVSDRRLILSIPGSLAAIDLAMEKLILPEIGHLVHEASKD